MVWTACLTALFAVLLRNAFVSRASRYPWLLAALGVGLNLLVVVANGGFMPQSAEARLAARGGSVAVTAQSSEPRLRNIVPMNDETQLSLLGDVIAEPAWLPNSNVVSIGDLLLGAGLAWWAFGTTASTARRVVR
jgi:hypothetical protein